MACVLKLPWPIRMCVRTTQALTFLERQARYQPKKLREQNEANVAAAVNKRPVVLTGVAAVSVYIYVSVCARGKDFSLLHGSGSYASRLCTDTLSVLRGSCMCVHVCLRVCVCVCVCVHSSLTLVLGTLSMTLTLSHYPPHVTGAVLWYVHTDTHTDPQ